MHLNRKYCLLPALGVCIMISSSSAQSRLDSMRMALDPLPENQAKVDAYKKLSIAFYSVNLDSSIEYASRGLALATELNYEDGIGDANGNLGIFYRKKEIYDTAIYYLFRSLEIKRKINDQAGIANTNNTLGGIYDEMDDPRLSFRYYQMSARYYESVNDTVNLATARMNIGNTYLRRRLDSLYDSALYYHYLAKPVYEERQGSNRALLYLNIGESYEMLGNMDSAGYYYNKVSGFFGQGSYNKEYARVCFHLGRYWLTKMDYEKAYSCLSEGYRIARSLDLPRTLKDLSQVLMDYFEQAGQYDSAYFYSRIFSRYSDELSFDEVNHKLGVAETTIKYQTEISERDKLWQREKKIRYLLFIISFLGILLTIYIYRSYRSKQKTNQLLAEMDSMKSRMYTNISHELRTPLTLILGPLEEMMEEDAKKLPARKTLAMMKRNASRLLQLVNQMLDLSRMDAGALRLELVEQDIIPDLNNLLLSFNSRAESKQICYTFEIDPPRFITWYDPDKVEKILVNLLSNAIKFTPEGGLVTATVKIQGKDGQDTIQIMVSDTGPGIPGEHLEKIFGRFYQVGEHAGIDQVGTGIGLALVKELVELMHGSIRVESEVGQGSRFMVEFTLGKDHLAGSEYCFRETCIARDTTSVSTDEEEAPEQQQEQDTDSGLPILLVVEDHEDIRRHIHDRLGEKYRVVEAGDGKEGYEKAVDLVPDIIITDLMMPVMDGVEMTRKLKTDERTSHIPIVMLTAKASVEDRIEGLETGADDYLTKPFHMKELAVRLQNLVEQRNLLREKYRKELKLEPGDIAVNSADERFLEKTISFLEINLADPDLDIQRFHDAVGMSRMQFFRKIKALTDHSPNEFIRSFRLKRAAQLLEKGYGNVAQVTYEVGFNNLSYFAKCFREMFGVSPSEYLKRIKT